MCSEVYRAKSNTVLISDTFISFTLTIWIPDLSSIQFRAVKLFSGDLGLPRDLCLQTRWKVSCLWSWFWPSLSHIFSQIRHRNFPHGRHFESGISPVFPGHSGSHFPLNFRIGQKTYEKTGRNMVRAIMSFWICGHLCQPLFLKGFRCLVRCPFVQGLCLIAKETEQRRYNYIFYFIQWML